MKKKKLAIVLSNPIQHFCPQYANWVKDNHWDIKVFFGSMAGAKPYFDEGFKKYVTWEALQLDLFPHEFVNGEKELPVNSILDAPKLEASLENYAPDAVLTYGYSQRLQRRAKAWANRRNIPLVYFADSELRQRRGLLKQGVKKLWVTQYFKGVNYFLVTGNANEAYYLRYGVAPFQMIRSSYPIHRNDYEKAWHEREQLSDEVKAKLQIEPGSIVVSMVGKLIDRKRQIDLIRALKLVKSSHITLLLIGAGEREQQWKQEAENVTGHRVVFTSFVDAHELPAYYAATDIYVHTSEAEPHSVAVSEAIYMGCPVIISHRCGSYGMDDDVRPGINGYVYPCGDIEKLAYYIQKLATDEPLRSEMSKQSNLIGSRQQYTTHFEALPSLHRALFV